MERGVVGERFEAPQEAHVDEPALADGVVEQCTQTRVGQREEAAGCDAVRLVAEPLGPHLVEVLEDALLEQFGVQRGNTVDRMAADGREMRHPHALSAVLTDQRHPPHPVVVAGELRAYLVEEAAVDLVDDLQVAGKRFAEHVQRPCLQRFRQQRVVGVAEGGHGDLPGLVPAEPTFVDEQPHQLGDADGRVSIVELQRESVGEFADPGIGQIVDDMHDVLQ